MLGILPTLEVVPPPKAPSPPPLHKLKHHHSPTHPPVCGRRCRLHTQLWLWMGFYCPRELRHPLRYPFSHPDRSGANTSRIPDLSRPARWPNAGFLSPIESRVLGTHTKDGCFSYRLHTTTPSPWPILRRPSPMLRRRTMSQMRD
jgi:hypothetical protein